MISIIGLTVKSVELKSNLEKKTICQILVGMYRYPLYKHDWRLQSESARMKTLRMNDKAETEDFEEPGTKEKAMGSFYTESDWNLGKFQSLSE